MRKIAFSLSWIAFVTVLLTQFVNCENYSNMQSYGGVQLKCSFDSNGNCVDEQPNNLNLVITSAPQVNIGINDVITNISGQCNDGGYANAVVIWELYIDGGAMTNSSQFTGYSGTCTRGLFNLVIQFPYAGLYTASGFREVHYVDVEIMAVDANNNVIRNTAQGRKRVYLYPM